MNYFRLLTLVTVVGVNGCLLSFCRKREEQKKVNEFFKTINPYNDSYKNKYCILPALKLNKLNKEMKRKDIFECTKMSRWNNAFKVIAEDVGMEKKKSNIESQITKFVNVQDILQNCKLSEELRTLVDCTDNLNRNVENLKSMMTKIKTISDNLLERGVCLDSSVTSLVKNFGKQVEHIDSGLCKLITTVEKLAKKELYQNQKPVSEELECALTSVSDCNKLVEDFQSVVASIHIKLINIEREEEGDKECDNNVIYDENSCDYGGEEVEEENDDLNKPILRFIDEQNPQAAHINYFDFEICYCRQSRLPIWTEDRLTCENVADCEHRHWELIKVIPKVPPELKDCTNVRENNDYDVVNIGNSELHPDPETKNCEKINNDNCPFCQYSTFWPLFYRYVKFLTKIYCTVHVFTTALYPTNRDQNSEQVHENVKQDNVPSQFIKCIYCENEEDGTSRLECYRIKNTPTRSELPNLCKYLESRDLIEKRTGIDIFRYNWPIRDNTPHKGFDPQLN